VFLFDEPLSNLDAKLRVQMRTQISKLHQQLGATMIYVTHDQTEAMTMGDKIVILKDGAVNQIDTPLNLYNYPANKFVAGFIGSPSMNFIEGKIIKNNGGTSFKSNFDTNVLVNDEYKRKLEKYINKNVWLGIRPEDIYDAHTTSERIGFNKLNVVLDVVEPMGNEIFLYFPLDGIEFVARIPAREKPEAGTPRTIYLDTEKLHFFDAETEKAIN
jgi:multiple sugar transport system ATP-binding protein